MKKNHIYSIVIFFISFGLVSCTEDVPEIGPLLVPTNLTLEATVSEDGSGLVTLNASADHAITYHYYLGLGASETPTLSEDGKLVYNYKQTGDFVAQVVAYGAGGISSNKTIDISVQVDYTPPLEVINALTDGSSRRWVWKAWEPAHFGVGPEFNDDGTPGTGPAWYQAAAYEKESVGCLYEDVITFTLNADESVSMTLENNGATYFHVDEVADALSVPRPEADQCYDFETTGDKNVGFFETTTGIPGSTNVGMEINGGFMSYYVNSSTYEILSITGNELYVRVVQDVDGFKLVWYHKFAIEGEGDPCTKAPQDYELVWSDEFDVDGAPSNDNWNYNIGTGNSGWGNQELQYYTDRPENVIVEDGSLKITAKKENFAGSGYTSARLVTEGKFEFTYGKVEMRAKLPSAAGTWPAGWLLGADYQTNSWPACGEIDFMEHVGNNLGVASAALHTPASSGATINYGEVEVDNISEWHVYSVEWDADNIFFYLDGEVFYSFCPPYYYSENYPFDHDFFLILNVAMGGTLGGDVDPNFTEDVFEIDYLRVYQ